MNKSRVSLFINMVESFVVAGMVTVIAILLLGHIKDIPSEMFRYNPSMPVLSRIVLNGSGFNYMNLTKFVLIGMFAFKTPIIGYLLTEDEYKSASLCLMPALCWITMAVFSYKVSPINNEIPFFLIAAFFHTVLSMVMYLRFLNRNVWYIEDEDYDFDEYYDEYDWE